MSDYALVLENTLCFDADTEAKIKDYIFHSGYNPVAFTPVGDAIGLSIDIHDDDFVIVLFGDADFLHLLARGNAKGKVCFGETGSLPGFRMWGVEFKDGRHKPLKGKIRWEMEV